MRKTILLSKRTSSLPQAVLEELLECRWFRDTIRVYNDILAFTSTGAKMDYSVIYVPGPYTFVSKTHHRIGSLILSQGRLPKYLQVYIFGTNNEVSNRLKKVMGQTSTDENLEETTIKRLIEMVDENNCLAKVFRRAHNYYETHLGEEFTIRLVPNKGKGKEYDLPDTSEVAGLIVGDMSSTVEERDIVVQFQSETLLQIRDGHPLYMSLQYPLLFLYGEYSFHTEIPLHIETDTSRTRQFLSIRQYYASQI
ncbi:LOW QUALITY PROTEIN: hypothetical protein N665_0003s0044 [Sinapis alba]|nr:LOW QUALITY PROTEIN: hypothetical protein N665_0003s0044 [Sinapis alba]